MEKQKEEKRIELKERRKEKGLLPERCLRVANREKKKKRKKSPYIERVSFLPVNAQSLFRTNFITIIS